MFFRPKQIDFNKIRILNKNPRYVDISEIDFFSINTESYDFNKAAIQTLKHEGDFSDFYDLIQQLIKGYNPAFDQIFTISTNNEYYVIEGNIRIIAMNIIK